MERDSLTVILTNDSWLSDGQEPQQPCLRIKFADSKTELADRFRAPAGTGYTPDDIDIFYRHQPTDPPEKSGVLSFADRLTGDYILETATEPSLIEKLVYAVQQYSETTTAEPQYQIELWTEANQVASFEKETLLVYGTDRTLLRQQSLIPTNVEI